MRCFQCGTFRQLRYLLMEPHGHAALSRVLIIIRQLITGETCTEVLSGLNSCAEGVQCRRRAERGRLPMLASDSTAFWHRTANGNEIINNTGDVTWATGGAIARDMDK